MPLIHNYHVETETPAIAFEREGFGRYLTLRGERAFTLSPGCDTCAFVFERIKSERLAPAELSERLRDGMGLFENDVLGTVAQLLPSGDYAVLDMVISPRSTRPCLADDYFSHESVELFGMPTYSGVPDNPRIPYWRAGDRELPRVFGARWAPKGSRPRLEQWRHLFHFIVPMEPPGWLDVERVAEFERQLADGSSPAALGISVLEVRQPADIPWSRRDDPSYKYGEHWCLATYLVDGHHKIEAAARTGRSIRLLNFLAKGDSIASREDIDAVASMLAGA